MSAPTREFIELLIRGRDRSPQGRCGMDRPGGTAVGSSRTRRAAAVRPASSLDARLRYDRRTNCPSNDEAAMRIGTMLETPASPGAWPNPGFWCLQGTKSRTVEGDCVSHVRSLCAQSSSRLPRPSAIIPATGMMPVVAAHPAEHPQIATFMVQLLGCPSTGAWCRLCTGRGLSIRIAN